MREGGRGHLLMGWGVGGEGSRSGTSGKRVESWSGEGCQHLGPRRWRIGTTWCNITSIIR